MKRHSPNLHTPAAILAAVAGLALAALLPALRTDAGGTLDFRADTERPGELPGEVEVELIALRWDPRTLPATYRLNDTLDPLPDPLGRTPVPLEAAASALRRAMETWNGVPTSYVEFRLEGTVSNPGVPGFDTVNEITFRNFLSSRFFGLSRTIVLERDEVLEDGVDLDGDGDSDVSATLTTTGDADGDGDLELPVGLYPAGTALDNDIFFNPEDFRLSVDPAEADTVFSAVDLQGVAVHELGHSLGLAHVPETELAADDGDRPVMFPFVDTSDPADELSSRVLSSDEEAWASLRYPEGTASSGPPALQPGDVPFDAVYGVLQGEALHGPTGAPLAGGDVTAVDLHSGRRVASGYTGAGRMTRDVATGRLRFATPTWALLDGAFTIPLPRGVYELRIEGVDGFPISSGSVSSTVRAGSVYGQTGYGEEFFDADHEAADERDPGRGTPVVVTAGHTTGGVRFVTNRDTVIARFGSLDRVGFRERPPGIWLAQRYPADRVAAVLATGRDALPMAEFFTFHFDASQVPTFPEALLTTGRVTEDGAARVDLVTPLRRVAPFRGKDLDFAPLYFDRPHELADRVARALAAGDDLFLVLRLPLPPFPGPLSRPAQVGVDGAGIFGDGSPNDFPLLGDSYFSEDGVNWVRDSVHNYMFRLRFSRDGRP